jgi:predicted nucleic acid-binding protein
MTTYLDTSVILPALTESHPLHNTCRTIIQQAGEAGDVFTTTLHTFAELYTHLSKPTKYNIHLPVSQIEEVLFNRLPKVLNFIELDFTDYQLAVQRCVRANLVSAIIYDTLHFQAARKCGANRILTDNEKDFHRLLTPEDPLTIQGIR